MIEGRARRENERRRRRSQLVVELVESRDALLETLPLADLGDHLAGRGRGDQGVTGEHLPVVEHALRERLPASVRAKVRGETERLRNGQVRLHVVDRCPRTVLLTEHNTTATVQHTVDTAHRVLHGLDVNLENGLHQAGLRRQAARVVVTASGRDHLTTATVDRVSVHRHVLHVDPDTTHGLLSHHTLLGGPVPRGNERVLNLVHVLHTLGRVHDNVGTSAVRPEAPDLTRLVNVPLVLVGVQTRTRLQLSLRAVLLRLVLDLRLQLLAQGLRLGEDTVVLVRRLAEALLGALLRHRLTERHNRLGDLQLRASHVVLLQVLQADLKVQLTGTGDHVLTALLDTALHQGVRLRQTLQTLNQLRQVGRVRALDRHAHDGRHTVLHVTERVSVSRRLVGDRGGLDDETVHTHQTDDVARRDVLHGLLLGTHHQHGALDVLHGQVLLRAVLVVRPHDTHLLPGTNLTGEDTPERDETTTHRNHLRDVQDQRARRVTVLDRLEVLVLVREERTVLLLDQPHVQLLSPVPLRLRGRRQLHHDHLEESVRRGDELLHDSLQQLLLRPVPLVTLQDDVQPLEHLLELLLLVVHHGVEQLLDRLHTELAERTVAAVTHGGRPLLALAVEEVVTPQPLLHLLDLHAELLGVHARELVDRERPRLQTASERHGALVGEHLHVTKRLVVVGGDHHVHRLDRTVEALVGLLGVQLQLQQGTVHLV
eukprot:Hpha_TRINITY_DN15896_c2_g10::TRINITY_DN15896_c2_g10_i5::g.192013::m.192013